MTAWRDALLDQRNGFGASVTGGAAAASPTVVTTLADSGPGSLREALGLSGPAWIEFGVTGTIALLSPIQIAPHKTIDGRSADITITDHGLYYSGALHGATANLIIAYLTLDHAQTNANDDGVQIDGGGIGADLGWVHHCTLRDGTDGLIDIVDVGGAQSRWTVDWCRFGPHPGPKAAASGHTDGKLCLCGRDDDVGSAGGIRVTWHHNYAFNCKSRQPRAQAALVHAYNCVTKFWGNTDATNSTAMACATEGQALAEGCIFEPYEDGDTHWLDGTVVTADKDAMRLELPGVGTEGVMKGVNNVLRNGAIFAERLPETVFDPSAHYSYAVETADEALEARVIAGAGNVRTGLVRSRAGRTFAPARGRQSVAALRDRRL